MHLGNANLDCHRADRWWVAADEQYGRAWINAGSVAGSPACTSGWTSRCRPIALQSWIFTFWGRSPGTRGPSFSQRL
ncbi:hypothetical protein GCM10022224_056170 [Nonomuraea antimicrobica]|uniref:Uncharacterized protein n=1 Tax=Nonomuraea antimicrobica TaxID=561173 RepID=A0ABP7C9C9_9ACTN